MDTPKGYRDTHPGIIPEEYTIITKRYAFLVSMVMFISGVVIGMSLKIGSCV